MGVVTLWFSGNWHHSSKIIYATFFRRFAAESICSIERLTCASSKTRLFPSALKRSNVSISRTEKNRVNATNRIGTPRSVNIQLEERERATIGREISLDGHTQARPTYT